MQRFRIIWTGSGVTGAAVSTVYSLGTTQPEAESFADALGAFVNQSVAEVGGAGLSGAVSTLADVVDEATGNITDQFVVAPPAAGSAGALDIAPRASQVLVRLRTNTFVGGRRLQGHIFIPSVKEAAIGPTGDLLASYATAIETAGATLTADTQLGVYSRKYHDFAICNTIQVPTKVAVLRSRRD